MQACNQLTPDQRRQTCLINKALTGSEYGWYFAGTPAEAVCEKLNHISLYPYEFRTDALGAHMPQAHFNKLQIGQKVVLNTMCRVYGAVFPTPSRLAWIAAGTQGEVAAVKVPAVRGREIYFVCVDFPPDTQLVDHKERPIVYANKHGNKYRVSAYAEELQPLT